MKSLFLELGCNDQKAIRFFQESLVICAHDHIFSRKLLEHFANAKGPMSAIVGDWLDLTSLAAYDRSYPAPAGSPPCADGDRPRERLAAFVEEYLQRTENGVVMCENWGATRQIYENWKWGPPPPVACYGDNEVYHIVTSEITDLETVTDIIREKHHWQTGVCSSCAQVPEGDIPGEHFLDEIVQNTRHIFIPAFDGTGYLIWSPETLRR